MNHFRADSSGVRIALTATLNVVIVDNMGAQLITRFKNVNPNGSILELVVWRVQESVPASKHLYKSRAVKLLDGQRSGA